MIEARRRAYLEAMGFDVWVARSAAQPIAEAGSQPGLLVVGPGQGSTLLVCAEAAQTAGKFAADLTRALGGDPAWAWPDRDGDGTGDGGGDSLGLEAAIGARLFTRVVIFGADTARWLFEEAVPEVVASAAVSTLDGLEELAVSSAAKRALWQRLQNPLRGGSVPDAA
ncbi:MAG: hypothetical protein ACSLE2_18395 [Lysobacterales bacterium]